METITQLIKKYRELANRDIEYINLSTVLQDLHQIKRHQRWLRIPKEQR